MGLPVEGEESSCSVDSGQQSIKLLVKLVFVVVTAKKVTVFVMNFYS